MKRLAPIILGIAALGFILSLNPEKTSAFSDVSNSSAYGKAILELNSKGVLKGYADGSFHPGAQINRAEFLKIVISATGKEAVVVAPDCFPDVTKQWFAQYVCLAKQLGIVSGYDDGKFRPENTVSFVEAAKILSNAYKQKTEGTGGEWYEPYVKALESGKAIPPSISSLDRKITRSEMAEMMWRISEGKTDQPTKGLTNIEHPEAQVNFALDTVQTAKSCSDLSAALSSAGSSGIYRGRGDLRFDEAMPLAPMMKESNAVQGATVTDYSQTNVQVEGVDEADIVKTDGTFIYLISDGKVRIVKAHPGDAMSLTDTIEYKSGVTPRDLYVSGGHLIVLADSWKEVSPRPIPMLKNQPDFDYMPIRSNQTTQVFIYSLSGGKAKEMREVSFDGNSVSSRLTGGKVYLVLRNGYHWFGGVKPMNLKEDELLPKFSDSKTGGQEAPVARCADIAILPHVPSPEFMTVAVISADGTGEVKKETILGNADNVYASQKNLYIATTEWNYRWGNSKDSDSQEKTDVYRFEFVSDGVKLQSQGKVPGHILNQFSMDENGDTFRIATTVQPVWGFDEEAGAEKLSSNNLYVLGMDLKSMGSLEGIAPGESIYAVRFMGNRAYIVTFKQVDPLFVIDTSDPKNPKILGKLKIPGYSNYLHPYDETHLIGFGKEVDESIDADKVHNPGAVYYTAIQGIKMALFDVSDVENPKEMFKEVIGDRGSDSPLLTDHKALLFDKERGLISFPVLVTKRPENSDANADGLPVFQGAYVYGFSLQNGFELKGKISHYTETDVFQKAGSYWYGGTSDIARILRIENSLVTISNDQVRSTSWPDIHAEGKVVLN